MARYATTSFRTRKLDRDENSKRVLASLANARDIHAVTSWYLIRNQDVQQELTPSFDSQRIAKAEWHPVSGTHYQGPN